MQQGLHITCSKEAAGAWPWQPRRRALLAGAVACLAAGAARTQELPQEPAQYPDRETKAQTVGITYAEWLSGHSDDWRVGRLASNPRIFLIEFPSLAAQGRALNRIAALLEKRDTPRARVLGDSALAAAIRKSGDTAETYLFGHDYQGEGLLRFFSLADRQKLVLNAQEQRLRELLLAEGVLGASAETPQALVTFTAVHEDRPETLVDESVDALRREAVLRHELSHGEFFTNAAYREHCWAFWRHLSDTEHRVFRRFLAGLDYDPADESLMLNEAQAFLMHTPDTRVFSAGLLGVAQGKLDDLRARFVNGMPPTLFSDIDR